MKNALLVGMREYAENARTKGFWIGLLIFPVILTAAIKVPMLLESSATPTRYFAVVDYSNEFGAIVSATVEGHHESRVTSAKNVYGLTQMNLPPEQREPFDPPRRRFQQVDLPADVDASDPASLREGLRPYLTGERDIEIDGEQRELFALVVIPADLAGEADDGRYGEVEFWSTNLADSDLRELIERGLVNDFRQREYLSVGVGPEEVERIADISVEMAAKDPSKEEGEEEVSKFDTVKQYAPIGFVYLLFVSIFTVSQMLLNSTIEEKSNRIVEVLFSSITPRELMLGKLAGIAAIGMTMLGAWFGTSYLVVRFVAGVDSETLGMIFSLLFAPEMILPFVTYFFLGYMLYAAVFIGIGSMCNTIKESQNLMGPVMLISMVPLFTMMFIPKDPNGTLASVLSWIPPWTPFVMMNRAAASPPTFDLVGTLILLVVSVAGVIWVSERVFRNSILRTGQPPKLLELLKLLRR